MGDGTVGIPDTPDNAAACLCGNCPSKVPDDRTFYCVKGHSQATVTRGFCACGWCPLWSCYALAGDFYCDAAPGGEAS
jgi:hypothetical protein